MFPKGFDKGNLTDDEMRKAYDIPAKRNIDWENTLPFPEISLILKTVSTQS